MTEDEQSAVSGTNGTPPSGRKRRSGLSRLAERRGLIASPVASTISLRSVEDSTPSAILDLKESGATITPAASAVTPEKRTPSSPPSKSFGDAGLPPPAPKSSTKSSSRAKQEPQEKLAARADTGGSGFLTRSRSSQDLAHNSLDLLNAWDTSTSQSKRLGRFEQRLERQFESSMSLTNIDSTSISSLQSNASSMRKIPVQDVRGRAFLHGSLSAAGQLGADQLDALIADRRIDVMSVTWNMAGVDSKSYPVMLESLLFPPEQEHIPDIYGICVQEATSDVNEFLIRCQATLGPNHVLFTYCRNKALLMAVFLRRDLIWFVSVPDSSIVSTRVAVATKGCTAICFTLFGTSMLFISSHFKQDDVNFEKRIQDYQKIVTKLDLPKFTKTPHRSADVTERFDYVFWSGDLNFRVRTGQGDRERVNRVLTSTSAASSTATANALTSGDELKIAQAEGKIFEHFLEGDIRFPPTYKFDLNSDEYDTSDKQRVPSYTDRILYRCRRPGTAKVTAYNSVRDLRCSDHRPVYAVINVLIRPGIDSIPLAHGRFCSEVYVEGNRRRATQLDLTALVGDKEAREKASQVCRIM